MFRGYVGFREGTVYTIYTFSESMNMNKKHLLQKGTYKIFLFSTAGFIWNRVRAIHPPIPPQKKHEKKTLNK